MTQSVPANASSPGRPRGRNTRSGSRRGGIDFARWAALALSALALAALERVSSGRMVALAGELDPTTEGLYLYHLISKTLLVFVALIIAFSYHEPARWGERLTRGRLWWGVLAVQLGLAAAMVLRYRGLPTYEPLAGLSAVQEWRYISAITLFIAWQAATLLLLATPSIKRIIRPQALLGLAGTGIALVALFVRPNPFVSVTQEATKEITVSLASWFYGLFGSASAQIEHARVPIMSAEDFSIAINVACAGYDGMFAASALMCGLVALQWPQLRPGRALAVIAGAVVGVFLLNSLRIALLFHIGVEYSAEMALEGFHSYFGTLALMSVALIGMLVLQLPALQRETGAEETRTLVTALRVPAQTRREAGALILPLAALLTLGMFVGLFSTGFNWLYPIPASAGLVLLYVYRRRLAFEFSGPVDLYGFAVGVGVYVLWIALIPLDPVETASTQAVLGEAAWPAVAMWIAFRLIGASIVVPVFEELAFRGGMMRLLNAMFAGLLGPRIAMAAALLISSFAFGILHGSLIAATLAGIAYGALVWRDARVGNAILAHAVTNFLIGVHVLALGAWSYW
ncbi:CAAX prenyl protease-related protein [Spiribacter sp. 221]|uniref:CAAX prenyl protease-related protein n=1 Tax=Spiribacter onubensis TaxID=3122420 RepID=UPI00349FADD4